MIAIKTDAIKRMPSSCNDCTLCISSDDTNIDELDWCSMLRVDLDNISVRYDDCPLIDIGEKIRVEFDLESLIEREAYHDVTVYSDGHEERYAIGD